MFVLSFTSICTRARVVFVGLISMQLWDPARPLGNTAIIPGTSIPQFQQYFGQVVIPAQYFVQATIDSVHRLCVLYCFFADKYTIYYVLWVC